MSRAPLHVLAAGLVCAWLLPIARCAKAARAAPARQVPSARSSAASPRAGALLMSDDFNRANGPNHLISNEWSYWDHNDSARVRSPVWQVTSGTLFSVNGSGWTGVPDDTPPDRYSEQHTDSQVLRVYTSRGNFGDVL